MSNSWSRRDFIKVSVLGVPVLAACAKSGSFDAFGEFSEIPVAPIKNFSFVHVSDTHISPFFEMPNDYSALRSFDVVQTMANLSSVKVTEEEEVKNADGEKETVESTHTTLDPDFHVHTGDIVEYGFAGRTWDVTRKYFQSFEKPIYYIAGNHDNTWVPDVGFFEKKYGGMSYTFDHSGVRFIGLNSATLQEPLPSFAEETVQFLKKTLAQTSKTAPIICYWHHPYSEDAFASAYDYERVVDELRSHNVQLVMLGHYHTGRYEDVMGIDGCIATATFSGNPAEEKDGYSVVDIQDGKLRVVDVYANDHTKTKILLSKDIAKKSDYPTIKIRSPRFRQTLKSNLLIPKTENSLELNASYKLNGRKISREADVTQQENGAHYLRAEISKGGKTYTKSSTFYLEREHDYSPNSAWRYELGAACQAQPLYSEGVIYVGDTSGKFRAIDAAKGKLIWELDANREVMRKAVRYQDSIIFGTGGGELWVVDLMGNVQQRISARFPVYCTPVVDEKGIAYFGNLEAEVIACDISSGKILWKNTDAQQSIESRVTLHNGLVISTCWDGYVYAMDQKTGELKWKKAGPRNQERDTPSRYYGPADNPPLIANNQLYIADRGYDLGIYDVNGNYKGKIGAGVSGMALTKDKKAIALRRESKPMQAIDLQGNVLWESRITLGRNPIEPTAITDRILAATNDGRLYCFNDQTGESLWSYNITPQLFVFGGIEVSSDETMAFGVGMDGMLCGIGV